METAATQANPGQRRYTRIITLVVVAFLLFILAIGDYILKTTEQHIRDNTLSALTAVLATVNDAVLIWKRENITNLQQFLSNPRVVRFSEQQLVIKRNPGSLRNSDSLEALREYYWQNADAFRAKGFFVIAPDRISLASSRDVNIGTKNLIHFHRPDLLNLAFQGNYVFIPPIESDVAIDEGEHTTSIFLAGPIRDNQGNIIAVGTLRLQPNDDFNRITALGRIGESGETYAFDQQGFILTRNRFNQHNIRLEEPGTQSLTRMAASAIEEHADGADGSGYRDYRGARVLGAWLWNEELGLGLASEIEESEALAPYHALRTPVFIGLLATGFVSLILLATIIIISRNNTRLLRESHDRLESEVDKRTRELVTAKDKAEEASRAKSDFLANVSHELRTPLTAIHGSIKLINSGAVNDESQHQHMMQLAEQNTERLIHLVNDLLDMEKIHAGKLDFHCEKLLLMPQIELAVAANMGYAEKYQVAMNIIERNDDCSVTVDAVRLQQVMSNLLSNGIKYSPKGGTVEIRVSSSGRLATIEVIDHGPGIPEDFHKRIFEQFTQADTSSSREKGGTGLGLHIAKQLIEAMGGSIDFTSRSGNGTTFRIELPLAE